MRDAHLTRFRAGMAALSRYAPSAPPPLDPGIRVGIAVSGGGDSLALLLLAHALLPGRIEAATFDHGLRPESADEAAFVARICARLGVPHETLRPGGTSDDVERERRAGGLQALARTWRYRGLSRWCGRRELPWLLTAHHAADQAETVLMRLARGSGPRGLGGIRPARRAETMSGGLPTENADTSRPSDLWVGRPLLGFDRAELRAIVSDAGIEPVADPSNIDPRYDRTHVRRLLADTPWLDPHRLAAVADIMRDTDEAVSWAVREAWKLHVRRGGDGDCLVDPAGLPPAILRLLCEDVIRSIDEHATGGRQPSFKGAELTRLIARLQRGEAATIAHVMASSGERWHFRPAPPRHQEVRSDPRFATSIRLSREPPRPSIGRHDEQP